MGSPANGREVRVRDTLEFAEATVCIEEREGGRHGISVEPRDGVFVPTRTWETAYPLELIRHVLNAKGPVDLCDEIRRDEDPVCVEHAFRWSLLSYLDAGDFAGKRVLDFGCGCGASTAVLARVLPPSTVILGVELREDYLELARHRARWLGLEGRVSFHASPGPNRLPTDIGPVDHIVMSAVYEHLLPRERRTVMPLLWSLLETGGILFLNQTPFRWFPIETHTTRLPLINYLPDRVTLAAARRLCSRIRRDETWEELLRRGIRGGTWKEIRRCLDGSGNSAQLLEPHLIGVRDRIGLWYGLSSGRRAPLAKKLMMYGFRTIKAVTGRTAVPCLTLAIRKVEQNRRTTGGTI